MREIKFRAWNKHSMLYSDSYASLARFFQKIETIEDENYQLMQYTGLKDKNGKEIWEGDIVVHGIYKGEVVFKKVGVQWENEGKYYCTAWYWVSKEADTYRTTWPLEEGSEIIGNVYENPELLSK